MAPSKKKKKAAHGMYAKKTLFQAEGWEQHSDKGLKVFSILCSVEKVFSNESGVNVYSDGEMIGNAHLSFMTGLSCIFLPLMIK